VTLETASAIAAMALATYGVRAAGLLLAARLPASGRWARCLQQLPPAVLAAIVAPAIATGGVAELAAALATLVAAALSRGLVVPMAAGVFVLWSCRHWLGAG
jgi:uncharacterized membrane protein